MFEGIRRELRELRESDPGTRFQGGHERHRVDNHVVRLLLICLGLGLALGGALTFWLPGPQFVVVLAGVAIVAAQWKAVARRIDRLEVRARRWHDERWDPYPHQRRVIASAVIAVLALVALVVWLLWRSDLLPAWLPFVA
jgi:uncharacterized membrane protein YfcA